MADGYTIAVDQKKSTYREGATDREVPDENVVELLPRVLGNGRLSSIRNALYVINDAPQVACDNHCGTHVRASPNGVECKRERTFVFIIFLIIILRILLIRVTRVCIGCQTS